MEAEINLWRLWINSTKTKIFYVILCVIVVFSVAIILFEMLFQILPYIYRLIPINNDVQYVYILGESTAVGFPYDNKISYSKITETIIKDKKINDKEIKLIHLEQCACQLYHQYINYVLYRYFHPTHRGIMLLYIGTNNCAKKELYGDFKRNLLLKIGVYKLFDKYIRFLKFNDYEFGGYDFQYEYEKIVLLAKKFGEDIYMSTISGNYEVPPATNNTPIENEEIDKLYFSKDYSKAKELCIRYLEDEKYEDKSQFWYRLGMILNEENNIEEANKALVNSVRYNIERKPNPIFQNEVIRKISKKYDIPLFDFFEQLCNSGKIIGFDFFVDWIHPNIETHIDIAYGFIDLLSRKYKFDFIKKEDLNIEELKRTLGFNNNDMAYIYMKIIMQLIDDITDVPIKFNEDVYLKWRKALEELEVDNGFFHNRENIEKFLKLTSEFREIMNSENIEDDLKENKLKKCREKILKLYKNYE